MSPASASHRPPPQSKPALLLSLLGQRLKLIGTAYAGIFFGVAAAVYFLERHAPDTKFTKFSDAVWFSIVTLSTVGYGDVYPVTSAGRIVVGLFIFFTLTTIGFLLTAFNEAVLEVRRMEETGLIPTRMKDHIIVVGFGPLVRVALNELMAADRQVAIIVARPEDIPTVRQWCGTRTGVFITAGEPTDDVLRDRLNAPEAHTAVVASEDDTLNLITALHLRPINPKLRIVVSLQREELRETMMASGVTYVASPHELSGRLVASAAFEPEVAKFVEDVTSGANAGHDLQQFSAAKLAGKTVGEVRQELEAIDGPLLVAVAQRKDGDYQVVSHPPRSLKVGADDHLIVLTNDEQAARVAQKYEVHQGR